MPQVRLRVVRLDGPTMNLGSATCSKPPYRIPTMAEIAAIRPNGLTVASLFAGCGGSSLGYRWAGFRILWANEFNEKARACYALNAAAGTIIDGRDVRMIQAAEISSAIGLVSGMLDVLDGSPPCQSFSTAGQQQRGWGKMRAHGDGTTQVSDDLFFEYARLLAGLRPRAFVAENVSGLVKGVCKGYFKAILAALRRCGYRIAARLLDAQWLGVPQARVRLIFVGVREDLGRAPSFPAPLPYRYSLRDALPEALGQVVGNEAFRPIWGGADQSHPTILAGSRRTSGTAVFAGSRAADGADVTDQPCPTVRTTDQGQKWLAPMMPSYPPERRKFSIAELRRVCGFPDDFQLVGTYAEQWARLGNAVPPPMMRAVAEKLAKDILL